jgi:hypothetical protein
MALRATRNHEKAYGQPGFQRDTRNQQPDDRNFSGQEQEWLKI